MKQHKDTRLDTSNLDMRTQTCQQACTLCCWFFFNEHVISYLPFDSCRPTSDLLTFFNFIVLNLMFCCSSLPLGILQDPLWRLIVNYLLYLYPVPEKNPALHKSNQYAKPCVPGIFCFEFPHCTYQNGNFERSNGNVDTHNRALSCNICIYQIIAFNGKNALSWMYSK